MTLRQGIAILALCALEIPAFSAPGSPQPTAPQEKAAGSPLNGLWEIIRQTESRLDRANQSAELAGLGPYPARSEVDLANPNVTIYRPADLSAMDGRKLGVLVWGNGGCSNDGASARAYLAEIASHGYLVVAPGKPLTGPVPLAGAPASKLMQTTIDDMRSALNWALAENGRAGSPYRGRIDPKLVAAAGHSCGGMLAILLGEDPRVNTVIIQNSGIFPALPDNPPLVMHEERLKGLHTSVLLLVGGKDDVAWPVAQSAFDHLPDHPVVLASMNVGHEGTFAEPHGGAMAKVAVSWLEWQLRHDAKAGTVFVGKNCALCIDSKWSIRTKRISDR
jgi:dienelactone hydrolase